MSNRINNVACIGCGTIGAGWVTRFLANQIKVKIYDPKPYAETRLEIVIKNTKRAYKNLFPNETINFKGGLNGKSYKNYNTVRYTTKNTI